MKIKVIYQKEIHRINEAPETYQELVGTISKIFGSKLEKITLQYHDSDGDLVMITSDEDYKAMIESEEASKTFKVFVNAGSGVQPNLDDSDSNESEEERLQAMKKEEEEKAKAKEEEERRKLAEELKRKEEEEEARLAEIEKQRREEEEMERLKEEKRKAEEEKLLAEKTKHEKEEEKRKAEQDKLFAELDAKLRETDKHLKEFQMEDKDEYEDSDKESPIIKPVVTNHVPVNIQPPKVESSSPSITLQQITQALNTVFQDNIPNLVSALAQAIPKVEPKEPQVVQVPVVQQDAQLLQIIDHLINNYVNSKNRAQLNESLGGELEKLVLYRRPHQAMPVEEEKPKNNLPYNAISPESNKYPYNVPDIESKPKPNNNVEKPVAAEIEEFPYKIEIVKELQTIPKNPTIADKVIRKTVSVKNTGVKAWPSNCFLENVDGIGKPAKLPPLDLGKEFTTVINIELSGKPGIFSSFWRFGYVDKYQKKHYSSKTFEFVVYIPENEPFEPKIDVNKSMNKADIKTYSKEIKEKAEKVKEIFPNDDIKKILEFVEQQGDVSVDEIVVKYISNNCN